MKNKDYNTLLLVVPILACFGLLFANWNLPDDHFIAITCGVVGVLLGYRIFIYDKLKRK